MDCIIVQLSWLFMRNRGCKDENRKVYIWVIYNDYSERSSDIYIRFWHLHKNAIDISEKLKFEK